MRRFKAANPALPRAGEGIPLVAELFGLDECRGDRPTVDRDQRPGSAARTLMNSAGNELLPGPCLTYDQHGCIGLGNAVDGSE